MGVYLNPEVLAHGQLYVAFSRTTEPKKLWIADDGVGKDGNSRHLIHGRIGNIVYDEAFIL